MVVVRLLTRRRSVTPFTLRYKRGVILHRLIEHVADASPPLLREHVSRRNRRLILRAYICGERGQTEDNAVTSVWSVSSECQ